MKKTASFFMAFALILSLMPCAFAANIAEGTCGTDITWVLNDEGVFTVKGTGAMQDYSESNPAPWSEKLDYIKEIIFDDGITSVGDYAFYPGIKQQVYLTFGESLKKIGDYAFVEREIENPQWGANYGVSGVSYRGSDEAYKKIDIGVGNTAFRANTTVYYEKVSAPISDYYWNDDAEKDSSIKWQLGTDGTLTVTGKGDIPFQKLEGLYIDDNYCDMYDRAVKKVIVSDGITTARNFGSFVNLTEVSLPETIKTIEQHCFADTSSLKKITLPEAVEKISAYAFVESGISEITIGENVTEIGEGAFMSCTSLTDVYFGGSKQAWDKIKIGNDNELLLNADIHFGEKSVDTLRSITLTIGKKEATVFGEPAENDVAPIIRNSRTMLPARFVVENLGAEVDWNSEKREVTIKGKNLKTNEDTEIIITIGAAKILVNGIETALDSPAFIENGRTYTPVRVISENLGAEVQWDADTHRIIIKKP